MKQKERQERSKEEIYQAALEEFSTSGYENVNMERICANHGISKGMMYHYYSSKDELFLLCAEKTFADLKGYIEENIEGITGHSVLDRVKHYFMLREYYFQQHPRQKAIFEGALIHPPRHLAEEIQNLRAPLRAMNRTFLAAQAAKMQLRPGLSQEKAVRYLESVEYLFWDLVRNYQSDQESAQLHTILQAGEELLEMALFGILQQGETE